MTPSHEGQSLFINTTFATNAEVRWSLVDGPKTTAQRCNSSTGTEAQPSLYNNVEPKRWIPLVVRAKGEERNARVLLTWIRTLTLTFWKWNSQQPIFANLQKMRIRNNGTGWKGPWKNRARTFQQNSLHTVRKGGWGRKTTNWILSSACIDRCVWHMIPFRCASQPFANDAYLSGITGWKRELHGRPLFNSGHQPSSPRILYGNHRFTTDFTHSPLYGNLCHHVDLLRV